MLKLSYSIIFLLLLIPSVFSATISLDKTQYNLNENVIISGTGFSPNLDVIIQINDPNGNTIFIDQIEPNSLGEFTITYSIPSNAAQGTYNLYASSENYFEQKSFVISSGSTSGGGGGSTSGGGGGSTSGGGGGSTSGGGGGGGSSGGRVYTTIIRTTRTTATTLTTTAKTTATTLTTTKIITTIQIGETDKNVEVIFNIIKFIILAVVFSIFGFLARRKPKNKKEQLNKEFENLMKKIPPERLNEFEMDIRMIRLALNNDLYETAKRHIDELKRKLNSMNIK